MLNTWGVVQHRVYQLQVNNFDEMKQRLLHFWHGVDKSIIDNAIDELPIMSCACVRAKGKS